MKFKVDDIVRITHDDLFDDCEGVILEAYDELWGGSYLIELYKGNERITQEEINEYYIYFNDENLQLIRRRG